MGLVLRSLIFVIQVYKIGLGLFTIIAYLMFSFILFIITLNVLKSVFIMVLDHDHLNS